MEEFSNSIRDRQPHCRGEDRNILAGRVLRTQPPEGGCVSHSRRRNDPRTASRLALAALCVCGRDPAGERQQGWFPFRPCRVSSPRVRRVRQGSSPSHAVHKPPNPRTKRSHRGSPTRSYSPAPVPRRERTNRETRRRPYGRTRRPRTSELALRPTGPTRALLRRHETRLPHGLRAARRTRSGSSSRRRAASSSSVISIPSQRLESTTARRIAASIASFVSAMPHSTPQVPSPSPR